MSIDVIITCYNEGDFIGEAVQSVLAQSRSDLIQKIIIADDGSDSKTINQLASVIDISHSKNLEKEYFISDPPIIPSTTLIKRATYDACGGFADDLKVFEDTELFIRLCAIGRVRFQEQPTLYKRYHPNSITGGVKDLMADHANVAARKQRKKR